MYPGGVCACARLSARCVAALDLRRWAHGRGSALETGVLPAPSFSNLGSAQLSDGGVISKQSRLNACHRQDFSYKDLCVNGLPTPVQSAFSEDRAGNNKVL